MTTQQKRRYALIGGLALAAVAFVLVRGRQSGGEDELLPVLEDPFGDQAAEDEELSLFDLLSERLDQIGFAVDELGQQSEGEPPIDSPLTPAGAGPDPVVLHPASSGQSYRDAVARLGLRGPSSTVLGPQGQTPPAAPGNTNVIVAAAARPQPSAPQTAFASSLPRPTPPTHPSGPAAAPGGKKLAV
jgi:hypothetical protein